MRSVLQSLAVFALLTLSYEARSTLLTTLPLPERPEGISEGPDSTVFVSQIISGSVLKIDVKTGVQKQVVSAQTDRQAWGLWYLEEGAIVVAGGGPSFGGGTPEVYLYNVESGETIVTCSPKELNVFGAFINDVTVWEGVVYATDSVNGKLMAMDVQAALAGTCDVWVADLPDNFDPTKQDDFGANGIVGYADGLLVAHEIDGSVWYIRNIGRQSTATFQEVIGDGGAAWADGLTIKDNVLYVTQNLENKIGVFRLETVGVMVKATFERNLTSPLFDTPATSAIVGKFIYSTNSRFEKLPEITEPADDTVIGILLVPDTTSGSDGQPFTVISGLSSLALAFISLPVCLLWF